MRKIKEKKLSKNLLYGVIYDKRQQNHFHQINNQIDVQLILNMFDQLIVLLNVIDMDIVTDTLILKLLIIIFFVSFFLLK